MDVRVIAATNVNLQDAVRDGKFRDDLYYRLNVITIRLPPLRERREDIPLLAATFIERISHELGKQVMDISEGAISILMNHGWPGNVRELENVIERAIITCRGKTLTEDDFEFLRFAPVSMQPWEVPHDVTLDELEKRVIEATIQRTGGNIKEAAVVLGHRPLDALRQNQEVRHQTLTLRLQEHFPPNSVPVGPRKARSQIRDRFAAIREGGHQALLQRCLQAFHLAGNPGLYLISMKEMACVDS